MEGRSGRVSGADMGCFIIYPRRVWTTCGLVKGFEFGFLDFDFPPVLLMEWHVSDGFLLHGMFAGRHVKNGQCAMIIGCQR